MAEIIFKEESYKIIGACFEVHKALWHGFSEIVYKDALEIEFAKIGVLFKREVAYDIYYKQQKLKHYFVADFVLLDNIVLEVKAGNYIGESHLKQTLNYLKASNLKLGMVINFGTPSMEYKRVIF
jgi:GxxExxY protein